MKYLIIDTESTGAQRPSKGSALDVRNRLCYIGICNSAQSSTFPIEYEVGKPYGNHLRRINDLVDSCQLLVFFNAKHDLHWLRRYGISINKPIWDCQLAEFIINGQEKPFPSLDEVSKKYGSDGKIKTVEEEYYNKGKDTDEVPQEILERYLTADVAATLTSFQGQVEYLKDKPLLKRLIWLNCQDEIITEEMEWNGLKFDISVLGKQAGKLETHIIEIDKALYELIQDSRINWESPSQVNSVLYGGEITFDSLESYLFHYKDPRKQPVTKMRHVEQTVKLPRLCEPIPRSELPSGGWSTTDKILRKLKGTATAKRVVELILDRRGTQTQIDRYFRGIPKKYIEMGWEDNIVHGQLHHVVAATGRLSSSNPNMQNLDERCRKYIQTRFKI